MPPRSESSSNNGSRSKGVGSATLGNAPPSPTQTTPGAAMTQSTWLPSIRMPLHQSACHCRVRRDQKAIPGEAFLHPPFEVLHKRLLVGNVLCGLGAAKQSPGYSFLKADTRLSCAKNPSLCPAATVGRSTDLHPGHGVEGSARSPVPLR